jgi:DNA-binding winged helix-turn-helix (wHTH) protein
MGGKYTIVRHDLGDGAIVEVLATCEKSGFRFSRQAIYS